MSELSVFADRLARRLMEAVLDVGKVVSDVRINRGLAPRGDDCVTDDGWCAWCMHWFQLNKPNPLPQYADLARRIQATAERTRIAETRVYRGVTLTSSKITYTLQPSMVYTVPSLISTSRLPHVALGYSEGGPPEKRRVLLIFEDDRGVQGVPVAIPSMPDEVVLPRGATYRVVEHEEHPGGGLWVRLRAQTCGR